MTKRERVREEQEERLKAIYRHLGTTVEDETQAALGKAHKIEDLSGRQLHDLTQQAWEQQHAIDKAALARFDKLNEKERGDLFAALLR